jgi:hypothetical protein
MHAYLPEHVYYDATRLYHQGNEKDSRKETWHMKVAEQIHTAHIANKMDGIGHYTFVPFPEFMQSPPKQTPVYISNAHRQKDGKEVHNAQQH